MMAYARLQFEDMSQEERTEITSALKRYCELATLAMVMITSCTSSSESGDHVTVPYR